MSKTSDKSLRPVAIPFNSQIFGYNHSENSDQDISLALANPPTYFFTADPSLSGLGDLYNIVTGVSQTDYMIRFLRPKFGQIIQAYLNIGITFAATEPNPNFNVSVGGSFESDNITANVPSSAFITSCMNVLNPPNALPFQGTAGIASTFYGINIQPLVPQVGAANNNPDMFSVGLHFITAPVLTGVFHLTKFFITGSVLYT
jgi:hypothetical protein